MSGIIRIDMPKGVEEGQTSLSPASPTQTNMGSPPVNRRNAVLGGYAAMVGVSALRLGINEVRAGGNEELATAIENTITGIGIVSAAAYTGGLSLIPTAIGGATQYVGSVLQVNRENKAKRYEESMLGSRITFNSGSGYEW